MLICLLYEVIINSFFNELENSTLASRVALVFSTQSGRFPRQRDVGWLLVRTILSKSQMRRECAGFVYYLLFRN